MNPNVLLFFFSVSVGFIILALGFQLLAGLTQGLDELLAMAVQLVERANIARRRLTADVGTTWRSLKQSIGVPIEVKIEVSIKVSIERSIDMSIEISFEISI